MKYPQPGQIYEGYRNQNLYEIITLAEDVDSLDIYVVYKQLSNADNDESNNEEKVFTRPAKSFFEEITYRGKKVLRFTEIKNKC